MRLRPAAMVVVVDFLLAVLLMQQAILALTTIAHRRTPPSIVTLGYYAVVVEWPKGNTDDVDTYVEDPQDQTVYFASPQVDLMHLEQDDLGSGISNTTTYQGRQISVKTNQERVIIQGIIPGQYIVDVHMFTQRSPGPVPVTIELVRLSGQDKVIETSHVTLKYSGDVRTAFRFNLNAAGYACCFSHIFRDIVDSTGFGVTVPPSPTYRP